MISKIQSNRKTIFIILWLIILSLFIFHTIQIMKNPSMIFEYNSEEINHYPDENKYDTDWESLPIGIYNISITYNSEVDITTNVCSSTKNHRYLYADNPTLSKYNNNVSFSIWANDETDNFHIEFHSDDSNYTINSVRISTARNSQFFFLFKYFILYICILAIAYILLFRGDLIKNNYVVIISILVITFISSLGLLTRYIHPGHDLEFHLLRIEGLRDSILNGNFPDKVQPNWCYGWGYAVSAMYGDLIILIPAIMRLIGYPIISAYKFYMFLINLGTAIITYKSFKIISGKRNSSLLVSFLYTLAPYRLCCIYIRGAFGEFTGMMFLPLIVLTLWYIYKDDVTERSYGKNIIIPALSLSALLQTHVLTCVMSSIFIILFAIIEYKKTIRKQTLIYIAKIIASALLLSLWFVIPFLRFYKEPLQLFQNMEWKPDFQWYGVSIPELIAQRASGSTSFNFAYNTSLSDRMPLSISNGLIIILLFMIYTLYAYPKTRKRILFVIISLTFLSVFMTTTMFPYDDIYKLIPILGKYIASVNLPYRYNTISIVLLSAFAAISYPHIIKSHKKNTVIILTLIVILIAANQSFSVIYSTLYSGQYMVKYDSISLNSNNLIGYEYLYEGTDSSIPEREHDVIANNVEIMNKTNILNSYTINCKSLNDDSFLELPLYYYPGYTASTDNGKNLTIERGSNNRIKVTVPNSFEGNIFVKYKEYPIWRISEIISMISFIGLIILQKKINSNNQKESNSDE